jgi:hypothetical protein
VTPASGTTACLGMLVSIHLSLGFRRIGRPPGRGGLFASFHVVPETSR